MSYRKGRVMRIDSSSEESSSENDDSVIIESSSEEVGRPVNSKENLNSNNSPSLSCIPASPDIFEDSTEEEEPSSREKVAPRSSSISVPKDTSEVQILQPAASALEVEFVAKARISIPVVDLEEDQEKEEEKDIVDTKLVIPSAVLKNKINNMEEYYKRHGSGTSSEGSSQSSRNGTMNSVTSTPFLSSSRKALDLNVTVIPHAEGRNVLNSSDEENVEKSGSENDDDNTPVGAVGGRHQDETVPLYQPRKLYQNVDEDGVDFISSNINKMTIEKPKPVETVHPFAKFDTKGSHRPLAPKPLIQYIDFEDLPESKRPQQPSMPFMNPDTKKGVNGTIELLYKIIENMPKEKDCVEDQDPRGLKVPLFPHQKFGVKWLHWKENCFPGGGILADEMGLGKTLMIIGLVLKARQEGKKDESVSDNNGWISTEKNRKLVPSKSTLVICPASVLEQWENEVKTKSRGLRVHIFHGPKRTSHSSQLVQYDIVITTYQTLGSEIPKPTETNTVRSPLLRINWERVVLDEGHVIRNRKTLAAQACYQLHARFRWVVTGTPVHNSPSDMHSLTQFLRLTPFSDEKVWDNWIGMKLTKGKENLQRLQTITKTILLRRTKDEVRDNGGAVGNLPPKTIQDIVVDLNEDEKKIYEHLNQFAQIEFRAFLNQRKERELQNAANDYMAGGRKNALKNADDKTFTHIFTLILRLRQAAVLPYLIHGMLEDDDTSDIIVENEDALKELNEDDIISKKNPAFQHEFESAKLQRVYEDLEEIRQKCQEEERAMDKVIIVSQWTTLLDIVRYQLKKRGFSITQLTGKTAISDRMEVMTRFNANKIKPQVMLLSLAAGGVGLNLIGANYLFFLDLHWNPQLEFQAQDRIHRFGQTKPVYIRRYIAKDTIESKILELQKGKVELATGIINAKKQAGGALTIVDMKMLFGVN